MNLGLTRISVRLAGGFGICVLLMIALVAFNLNFLRRMERLHREAVNHAAAVELAIEAEHTDDALGVVIGHAVINRDLAKSEKDWTAAKKENLEKLQKLERVADTPVEHAIIKEARAAFGELVRIYEQEMLPLLAKGAMAPGRLSEVDARIDSRLEAIGTALQRVRESESEESKAATRGFSDALTKMIKAGLAFSLLCGVAAISVAAITTRRVVRPLFEMTGAALEIEKGNYHVELKHRSADETGILANAFRSMSKQVEMRAAKLSESNTQLSYEITERKLAEEEIRRLNAGLEQRVAERTTELAMTVDRLRQENEERLRTEESLKASREQLRNLSARLDVALETERERIAREIHDELGQLLTVLKFDLSWLRRQIPGPEPAMAERVAAMNDLIDTAISTVQRIATELRPRILDHLGLAAAIEWYAQNFQTRTGIACHLDIVDAEIPIDPKGATVLFRICQEALTNVMRHAKASRVEVKLCWKGSWVFLEVADDGQGVGRKELADPKSIGLAGMRERAHLLGGKISISGARGKGTKVKVTVPVIDKGEAYDQSSHSG